MGAYVDAATYGVANAMSCTHLTEARRSGKAWGRQDVARVDSCPVGQWSGSAGVQWLALRLNLGGQNLPVDRYKGIARLSREEGLHADGLLHLVRGLYCCLYGCLEPFKRRSQRGGNPP